jgi:hypothetical protein
MGVQEFTLEALKGIGIKVKPSPPDLYSVEESGHQHYIRFKESSSANVKSTLYNEETGAFQRLVDQVVATALHNIEDIDSDPEKKGTEITRTWVGSFGGVTKKFEIENVERKFEGSALIRVRATVLHDSYERLVEVRCLPDEHVYKDGRAALRVLAPAIADATEVGLNLEKISEAATIDDGIAEFSRFYIERREQEVRFAGSDERKRRKLFDEFTPRFEATVVALEGKVHREIVTRACFDIDDGAGYESVITTIPSQNGVSSLPPLDLCAKSGRVVPKTCLRRCQVTGAQVLQHLLVKSELSGREVLPEYIETCDLSGKRVVEDELSVSDVSGKKIISKLLKRSPLSGKRAEPQHFSTCAFTGFEMLKSELSKSEISGRLYRVDQGRTSDVSGKQGHKSEFVDCYETRQSLAATEAERCEESGKLVRPGILLECGATGKRVLPSLCGRCAVTGKNALKRVLVSSSLSGVTILPDAAVRSSAGQYCVPAECQTCAWSGQHLHPNDLGICALTGLAVNKEFLTKKESRLRPLFELLDDKNSVASGVAHPVLEAAVSRKLNGLKCRLVSGAMSPTKVALAVCAETKSLLGLKKNYIGFVFSPKDREIVGKVTQGKRSKSGWIENS